MKSLAIGITLAFFAVELIAATPATSQAVTNDASKVEMIFWEKQSWESGGGSERLTLWADGRSQITLKQFGEPQKAKAGWTASKEKHWTYYRKENPYPTVDARRKFEAAIAAGIGDLRTFKPGYSDGSGTLAGVQVDGKLKQTIIPMFLHEGEKDNKGSENHRRFLAVEAVLGGFDTDATE